MVEGLSPDECFRAVLLSQSVTLVALIAGFWWGNRQLDRAISKLGEPFETTDEHR